MTSSSCLWASLTTSLKRCSIAALHKRLARAEPLLNGDLTQDNPRKIITTMCRLTLRPTVCLVLTYQLLLYFNLFKLLSIHFKAYSSMVLPRSPSTTSREPSPSLQFKLLAILLLLIDVSATEGTSLMCGLIMQ